MDPWSARSHQDAGSWLGWLAGAEAVAVLNTMASTLASPSSLTGSSRLSAVPEIMRVSEIHYPFSIVHMRKMSTGMF